MTKNITLDRALTIEELFEAIGDISSGKAPGSNGLPIEFSKTFKKQLARPLLDMYKESFIEGAHPDSLRLIEVHLAFPNRRTQTAQFKRKFGSQNDFLQSYVSLNQFTLSLTMF